MSTQMQWFRMYTDFITDPKIIAMSYENQRHFVTVMILKAKGVLDQDCSPQLMDRIVAQLMWINPEKIVAIKNTLIAASLIDENWQPKAWEKRQQTSDHKSTGAERQRRYRERQKLEKEMLQEGIKKEEIAKVFDSIDDIDTIEERDGSDASRNAPVTHNVTHLDKNRIDKKRRGSSDALRNDATHENASSDSLPPAPPCPVQKIVDLYHEHMPDNPEVKLLNKERIKNITEKWQEAASLRANPFGYQTVEDGLKSWETYFEVCSQSPFLCGKVPPGPGRTRPFIADMDFLISENGFRKCLENTYHRKAA